MRPYQYPLNDSSITIDKFGGINRKKSIGAGEFESAINLCSDEYPCLMPRRSYDRFLFNKYALQWKNNNMFYALYPAVPYEDIANGECYVADSLNAGDNPRTAIEEYIKDLDESKRKDGYRRILTDGRKRAFKMFVDGDGTLPSGDFSEIKSYILTQGFISVELAGMPYFKNPVCTNISQQTVICDEINGMIVIDYDESEGRLSYYRVSEKFVATNTISNETNAQGEYFIDSSVEGFCHMRFSFTDGTPVVGLAYAVGDTLDSTGTLNKSDYLIAYGDTQADIGSAWFRIRGGVAERVDKVKYKYWFKGKPKFKEGDYLYFSGHKAYYRSYSNAEMFEKSFVELDGWHEIQSIDAYTEGGEITAYAVVFDDYPPKYAVINNISTIHKKRQATGDSYYFGATNPVLGMYLDDGFTIERKAPEKVNYICTSNNRVWCNNGPNEIMCSAQGNPNVWYKYEGNALDSYAVTVGGDGAFTGCIEYGYPMFFKNDEVFRISGTRPSNYQTSKYSIRGVKNGCHNSLAIVNDALYYQSKDGVYRYAGSTPVCISDKIYRGAWEKGYACRYRDKYYICVYERISDDKGEQKLYSFDTMTGIWHEESFASGNVIALLPGNFRIREEEALTIVTDYTNAENDISTVLIEDNSGWILDTATEDVEERKFRYYGAYTLSTYPYARYSEEDAVEWECTTGDLLHAYNEHKYLKRVFVSAELDKGSSLSVYVEYDRCGRWDKMNTVTSARLNTYRLHTANLNRCESFKIKLKGRGNATIHSINAEFEIGSDYE